ncbi:type II toxin-antitoxin system RelE/ParE family toxin [Parapedobacter tibetensis]|uniref:type II toxin-antitoxin system RelE/ParE family toxin n=1 Tax=Parapedobacter tibetensis TaxID=2972951 RepID=UPI00214D5D3C|nr:type II toxin-antitoxin system RelE/ParE family toxin [Parapedobacter tibetensis]
MNFDNVAYYYAKGEHTEIIAGKTDKQAKRLAKKYPSLKMDLAGHIKKLADEPEQGMALGNSFYKIRLAIASKGKSGGARVVTYVKVARNTVYLSSIFDKSERSTVTDRELEQIFKMVP